MIFIVGRLFLLVKADVSKTCHFGFLLIGCRSGLCYYNRCLTFLCQKSTCKNIADVQRECVLYTVFQLHVLFYIEKRKSQNSKQSTILLCAYMYFHTFVLCQKYDWQSDLCLWKVYAETAGAFVSTIYFNQTWSTQSCSNITGWVFDENYKLFEDWQCAYIEGYFLLWIKSAEVKK